MKRHAKEIIATLIFLGILVLLLYTVDVWLDGVIAKIFKSLFIYEYTSTDPTTGKERIISEVSWYTLKYVFVAIFFILAIVIWFTVSKLLQRREKRVGSEIAGLIADYMDEKKENYRFPKEYAQVETQLVQIKSTMNRQAQSLKEEAARKNDLITYLAHDLKTPLASVIGYLCLLDEAPDLPANQRAKYTGITLDKAYRLEMLINEFFEITRYNLQSISLEKEQIDLHYLLLQLADEFYPLLEEQQMKVQLEVTEDLMIYGDGMKLARVFNNILKNAIAYGAEKSNIVIEGRRDRDRAMIFFKNAGRTIPKEKLDKIFEKFFRMDQARTTNSGGAGLGLAIAREIIKLHNGEIGAESSDGVTTFTVILPCH